jgi:hypothetical protein
MKHVSRRRGGAFDEGLGRLTEAAAAPVPVAGEWLADDTHKLCDALLAHFFTDADPADDVALLALAFDARPAESMSVEYAARSEVVPDLRHTLGRWLTAAGADDAERFDLTVAVAEAASNAVEHGYGPATGATFTLSCALDGDTVECPSSTPEAGAPPAASSAATVNARSVSSATSYASTPASTGPRSPSGAGSATPSH